MAQRGCGCHFQTQRDALSCTFCLQYDDKKYASLSAALAACAVTPKVTEFGIAQRLRRGAAPSPHKPSVHTAPEVVDSSRLHLAADVYAFGAVMWEVMMGKPARCDQP